MGQINEKSHTLKNGKKVIIRTVKETDAAAFLKLAKQVTAEEIYSLTQASEMNMTIEQEQEWLRSAIENSDHLVVVAELDGEIVGQLDFSNGHRLRNSHTGEFGMGVHKDYREIGIGSLLISALIDWAKKSSKIEKINLSVHQTNERAIATYKKLGFTIEGQKTKDLKYPNNVYIDTILMGLWLK